MNSDNSVKNLIVAPATLHAHGCSLIWDKPLNDALLMRYLIKIDNGNVQIQDKDKTFFNFNNLEADTAYRISVTTEFSNQAFNVTAKIDITTPQESEIVDITKNPYFADPVGQTDATAVLQRAINECPKHGTILIPEGVTILSGAIDMKSDISLKIDGILKGSLDPTDYLLKQKSDFPLDANEDGLVRTRYEGWEMYCFRSLINIGYLDVNDRNRKVCKNVRIFGKGTILGGGMKLGDRMKSSYADSTKYPEYVSDGIPGRRVRGRLVNIIQSENIHFTGVKFKNPPCWTLHFIYSDKITINSVEIDSQGIDNGDGIDPDSTSNMVIFDVTFNTGDDCIAIKSGKNPEGNQINIPSKNIKIFSLNMLGGHGMAIGSEQSGGIENVEVRDCLIKNTDSGIELKASDERGGYIRDIVIQNCRIDSFFAHDVKYNSDGSKSSQLPKFKNIMLENIEIFGNRRDVDVMGHPIESKNKAIELIGFGNTDQNGDIEDVQFKNIEIDNSLDLIRFNKCKNLVLKNVFCKNSDNLNITLGRQVSNVCIS